MGVQVKIEGDKSALLKELARLSSVNASAALKNISEGLRTSTMERFRSERAPDGTKWTASKRAEQDGGKTLTRTTMLKQSVRSLSTSSVAAVGTNDIRAATHQFGEEGRVISARKKKNLAFKIGNRWISAKKVTITIPARPFLGISEEDVADIRDEIQAAVRKG